ncbi:MAG: hypothetical protein U9Q73_02405 [Nanoarchaeota archaeon]|nr:hypothetical protein [Nanoarchaeota archaeon]
MKILVIGTWQKEKALKFKDEAELVGKILAERGYILISGAGTGVSEIVVNSYRENEGIEYIAYIPSIKEMEKVGEKIGPEPDTIIKTELEYPERDVKLVKESDAVLAINGGLGTLTEMVHAIKDYGKKVSVIDVGELSEWVRGISELRDLVMLTSDVGEAIDYLEKEI